MSDTEPKTVKEFKAYHDADRLIRHKPKPIIQLKQYIDEYYPDDPRPIKSRASSWLERNLTAENFILLIGVVFFGLVALIFIFQVGQGNNDYINLWNLLVGSGVGGATALNKLRAEGKKSAQALAFSDMITSKELAEKKMIKEYEIQALQVEFFTKEMIYIIRDVDEPRLAAIELALQSLVYKQGGLLKKEIEQLIELLTSAHAIYERQLKSTEQLSGMEDIYEYLDCGVVKLDNNGIIQGANSLMKRIVPGVDNVMGKHFTYKLNNRPGDQTKTIMKMVNDGLAGNVTEVVMEDFRVGENQTYKQVFIKVIPDKKGGGIVGFFRPHNT